MSIPLCYHYVTHTGATTKFTWWDGMEMKIKQQKHSSRNKSTILMREQLTLIIVKKSNSLFLSVSQSVNKLSLHVQMLTINYQFEKNKIKIIMSFNDDTSPVGVTWAWCCYRWLLLLVVVVSLVTEEFRNHSVTNGCFYLFIFFFCLFSFSDNPQLFTNLK